MHRNFSKLTSFLTAVFFVSPLFPQLDLSQLNTNSVRQNQPWMQIDTRLDSLGVNLEIDRGIVTSTVTFQYTAGSGYISHWQNCNKDGCAPVVEEREADSLESMVYFTLDPATVVSEMFLWVEKTKVEAALQDRGLASAQYESIVKRRLDPALLETWGDGNYSLRIFPIKSGQTRKLEIRFVQGMTGKGDTKKAVIPVMHTEASQVYRESGQTPAARSLGNLHVTARSLDGQIYALNWPGLGDARIGSSPVRLQARNLTNLGRGSLSASSGNCRECLHAYSGQDSEGGYFGVMAELVHKELKFAPEPEDRIVLMDVDGRTDAANLDRARKLALLAMKGYGQSPYRANLYYRNAAGKLVSAFTRSETMTPAALQQVFINLKKAFPSPSAAHESAIDQWLAMRNMKTPAALILLSDENHPQLTHDFQKPDHQKFYDSLAAHSQALGERLKKEQVTLFGYWMNHYISETATATGGKQLGSLSPYFHYYASKSSEKSPSGDVWNLPPLFGPGRDDGYWGAADFQVKIDGVPVQEFSHVQDNRFPFYGGFDGPIGRPIMLAKQALSIWPGYPTRDTTRIYMAGRYTSPGERNLSVTGVINGLSFTADYRINLALRSGPSQAGKLWAYIRSEALNGPDEKSIEAVKNLGKKYHIVNRQMSLLALEPGMTLWDSLPAGERTNAEGTQRLAIAAPTVTTDQNIPSAYVGTPLDSMSLEEILGLQIASIIPGGNSAGARLEIETAPGRRLLVLAGVSDPTGWRLSVRDIRGKSVAQPRFKSTGNRLEARFGSGNLRGTYWVVAEKAGLRLTKRMVLIP